MCPVYRCISDGRFTYNIITIIFVSDPWKQLNFIPLKSFCTTLDRVVWYKILPMQWPITCTMHMAHILCPHTSREPCDIFNALYSFSLFSLPPCLRPCCLAQVPLGLIEATEVFGAKDKLLVLCRDARTFRSAKMLKKFFNHRQWLY